MKIYAHRGASGEAPENTIDAFKKALEYQVDGIETDVQLTKDNVLVLIHDETIDRTTNGKGFVKDYTYQQLLEFDASNGMEGFSGCKIPTLRELFDLVKDTDIILHLELKTSVLFYEGIEKEITTLVREYGYQKRVIYSSFNHITLQNITRQNVKNRVGFLLAAIYIEPWNYVIKNNGVAIHPSLTCIDTPNFMKCCHMQNLKVNVWTVNTKEEIEKCIEKKVDGIFTNYPMLAMSLKK